MNLTNETYVISLRSKSSSERYFRDKTGWLKVSAQGREFRMTAEQVLNHVLPVLAGIKPGMTISVEHREHGTPNECVAEPEAQADGEQRSAP